MNQIGIFFCFILISVNAWCQKRPPTAEALLEKGIELLNENHYAQALSTLNESIKLNPKLTEAYSARAEVRERLGDLNGAMIDYAICVELLPLQFDPLFSLAVIRYELKMYELAREDFLKVLKLDPGTTNRILYRQTAQGTGTDKILTAQGAIQSEILNYLGLIEMRLNNCKKGIHYLDSAILLNPQEADYFDNRALAKQACNDPSANDDFKRALAINPDHALTKHNMTVQAKENTFDQTEKQLTDIIRNDSSLQYPFIARAYYRLTNGNYKGAVEDYTLALKIDSEDPSIWLNRGVAKEKLNDLTGAFSDYTQAIELKETYANAWVNRANVLLKQKRFQDAIDDYTIAILHQPGYGYAYVNRALAKHYSQMPDACADLKQAESLGIKIEKTLWAEVCK